MPEWFHHFAHLVVRIFLCSAVFLGTSAGGLGAQIVTILMTELHGGFFKLAAWRENWRGGLKRALIPLGIVWSVTVLVCIVTTIYDDHQALVARLRTAEKSQDQTENPPKLSSEILTVYAAPTTEKDELLIVLVARIKNAGSPSAVSRMWVSLDVQGEKYGSQIVLPPERLIFSCVECPDTAQRTFYKEDLLTLKVAVIPIPQGGIVSGFIPIQVHGITEKQFANPATVLHLKIEDVRGNLSIEDEPMGKMLRGQKGWAEDFPFGMKEKEK